MGARRATKSRKPKLATTKITDYWSPCKSKRLLEKHKKAIETTNLHAKILSGVDEGVTVKHFPGKGRGLVATRDFAKGDFVLEYVGEVIDLATAQRREVEYDSSDCYMFFYQFGDRKLCVDATEESGRMGRLMNHSRLRPNCRALLMEIDCVPHITMWTVEAVQEGEELTFDYGDRSSRAISDFPWLANS